MHSRWYLNAMDKIRGLEPLAAQLNALRDYWRGRVKNWANQTKFDEIEEFIRWKGWID